MTVILSEGLWPLDPPPRVGATLKFVWCTRSYNRVCIFVSLWAYHLLQELRNVGVSLLSFKFCPFYYIFFFLLCSMVCFKVEVSSCWNSFACILFMILYTKWARFSTPIQTSCEAHPAPYTMGTRSSPGVKRPGHGIDHSPPSSAEVKERVELYLVSSSGLSWPVLGWTLPLLCTKFWVTLPFLMVCSFWVL